MDKYHDCGHRPRNTDKRKRKREVESNTPETQKVFDWFYSRNADRVSSFIGINRVQARMEDLERERDMAREKLSHAQALLAEMQDALKLAVKQLLKKNDA
jgi:hypothetical protein